MTNKILSPQQLKAVCDILGNTNEGFTKTELTRLLQQSQIILMDDGNTHTDYGYKIGLNKRDWLYSCLAKESLSFYEGLSSFERDCIMTNHFFC